MGGEWDRVSVKIWNERFTFVVPTLFKKISLDEYWVSKWGLKWTYFAYNTQIDTHTRINTGACRSAKTSKLVCYKITIRLQDHTYLQNTLWQKTNLERNYISTTLQDTKTQNHFVEKRERTSPPAEISCSADNSGAEVRKNHLIGTEFLG